MLNFLESFVKLEKVKSGNPYYQKLQDLFKKRYGNLDVVPKNTTAYVYRAKNEVVGGFFADTSFYNEEYEDFSEEVILRELRRERLVKPLYLTGLVSNEKYHFNMNSFFKEVNDFKKDGINPWSIVSQKDNAKLIEIYRKKGFKIMEYDNVDSLLVIF